MGSIRTSPRSRHRLSWGVLSTAGRHVSIGVGFAIGYALPLYIDDAIELLASAPVMSSALVVTAILVILAELPSPTG